MDVAKSPRKPLSELIGNLGYTGAAEKRALSGEATTKRRRIELQDPATTSVLSRQPKKAPIDLPAPAKPKKRSKSPAKKPRTITDAATAAYQPPRAPAEEESTASKFFAAPERPAEQSPEQVVKKPAEKPAEKAKKPRKPRAKAIEGSTTATTTTKKPAKPRKPKVTFQAPLPPPLYSPRHAHQQADQQSFLFGTSSQLAAEESPTFIREMQAALIESEFVPTMQAMGVSQATMSCARVPTAPHGTSLPVGQANSEHWRAASRDWKGGLLREKSGLKVRKKLIAPVAKPAATEDVQKPPPVPAPAAQTATVPLEEKPQPASKRASFVDIDAAPFPPVEKLPGSEPDSFVNIDDISDHEAPPTPSPPRCEASASPKPVPPLVFDVTSSSPAPVHIERPTKAASPPRRKASASPRRIPPASPKPLPPLTFDVPISPAPVETERPVKIILSASAVLKPADAQWLTIKAQLFPQVTVAVKTAKRSTDPAKPSWHQKILLYDPIVLEDLTAWLNPQGLRVGVQRQKAKKSAKGRKKKGAEGDAEAVVASEPDHEVVQEELQAWMVQKWCEEKSVCCLWKEGLRGGVKSSY